VKRFGSLLGSLLELAGLLELVCALIRAERLGWGAVAVALMLVFAFVVCIWLDERSLMGARGDGA